jgi:hypothetical protein
MRDWRTWGAIALIMGTTAYWLVNPTWCAVPWSC